MKKILAFAGSNSSKSINHQLIISTANLIDFAQIDVINLREYSVHMFGVDIEEEEGSPAKMIELLNLIQSYDGFIISTPEHNSMPPAFFLNIIDWLSRIDRLIFGNKPTLVMSTSPGPRAGISALTILENTLPRFGAEVTGAFSFPSFNDNLKDTVIHNEEELEKLKIQIQILKNKMNLP
jgi:NAD(P)H-dependent FMN reductase